MLQLPPPAGDGPSGEEMLREFCCLHQLAAPAAGVQESGASANVWSQYFGPLWSCNCRRQCRRAWGDPGCMSSHRVNGERDRAVQKTSQSICIRCLKLDSVNTSLGSLCCLR